MKTKLISPALFASLGLAFLVACSSGNADTTVSEETAAEVKTSTINTGSSKVMWKGTMLGVYSHEGTVKITEGSIETTGGQITAGSFKADLTSMTPTDENYDVAKGSTPEKLVGHLQSAEFFDVANFPTAEFVVTGSNGSEVSGKLTIRGITNEEVVKNVVFDEVTKTWTGSLTIDRKKYGVSWDSQMKDMVLSNDVELNVSISI